MGFRLPSVAFRPGIDPFTLACECIDDCGNGFFRGVSLHACDFVTLERCFDELTGVAEGVASWVASEGAIACEMERVEGGVPLGAACSSV